MDSDLFTKNVSHSTSSTNMVDEKTDSSKSEEKFSKDYRRFVPSLALKLIEDRISAEGKEQFEKDPSFVKEHWSVMLFLDISGFTRLSQTLGAEKTKKHCNIYFTRILNVIGTHFGDVYKFLGHPLNNFRKRS